MKAILTVPDFDPSGLTISRLIDLVVQDYVINERVSLQDLLYMRKHIDRLVGGLPACDAKYLLFEEYKRKRKEEGAADSTTNSELSWMSKGFTIAKKAGLLNDKPIIELYQVGRSNARTGFVEPERAKVIFENLLPDIADFAEFGYLSGWRFGEIQTLEWCCVDKDAVRLHPKNSKKSRDGRLLPLNEDLDSLIERRERAQSDSCDLVFHRNGKMIKDFTKAWKKAVAKAGVPGLVFHDFRRSFCRNARKAGNNEETVMKLSGHKTREIFRRYNIHIEDDILDAAIKISLYLRSQGF